MQIRVASKKDLEALALLDQLCFPNGTGYNGNLLVLRQFLDIASDYFLVAESSSGALAGYILCARSSASAGSCAHLLALAVRPDQRAEGIAQKLAESLLPKLLATGIKELAFTTREDNLPVMHLASKWCSEVVGREFDYFGPQMPRLLWKLAL